MNSGFKKPVRNRYLKIVLLFVGLFVMLTISYGKLPVYRSVSLNKVSDRQDEKVAVNYDKKGKLFFGSANDDSLFFLRIVFADQGGMMKLMRGGLSVFFDPSGKKKRNLCLKLEKSEMPREGMRRPPEGEGMGNPDQRMRNPAGNMDQLMTRATWTKDGRTLAFNRALSKGPIKAVFLRNDKGEVVFELTVPLKELDLENGQQIFSVGIETGEMSQGSFSGGGSRSGGMGGEGRGGMEGGRMGGGGGMSGGGMSGGGRMGGGGMGGPRPGGGGTPDMSPLKLWFLVEI